MAVRTPSGVSKRLTISSTVRMAFAGAGFGAPASIRSKGTAIVPPPALHPARHGSPVCMVQVLAYSTSRALQARSSRCDDVAGCDAPFEKSVITARRRRQSAHRRRTADALDAPARLVGL